jgi:uncharacterized alpha-E superfamily protein
MLSRTANHLYWLARYIERAENMARILEVTANMAMVPNAAVSEAALWQPALEISGNADAYKTHFHEFKASSVIFFLALDEKNPSSIYSALFSARENARAVRVAMTSETWENINTLWLEFQQFQGKNLAEEGLRELCDWVQARSHLFRGVSAGTMLRDDAFEFLRLGTFIERADNTARLLDVKYHLLLPQEEEVGGGVDYYEWSAVLRSVSAFQAYQKLFNDTILPWRVAELLVLRRDMPRSLHACFAEIVSILENLTNGHHKECKRIAGEINASLLFGRIDHIFQNGLHEFLTDFIERNHQLGLEIQNSFLNIHAA